MNDISQRFKEFRGYLGMTQQQLADLLGVSKDRIGNWDTRTPPPHEVIIVMMKNFHLNPYWLLLGDGEMTTNGIGNVHVVNHGKESNVVTTGVNNGNIVAQAGKSVLGGRDVRICQFVRWWMDAHEPDDQAWFEKQLERAVPEYGAWKKSNR